MAKVTKYDPQAAAMKKAQRTDAAPVFAFSPKTILWISLLVGVPIILFLGKIGPVRAMQQWQELEPKLTDQTADVVQKVLLEQYKDVKFDEFVKPPRVTNTMLDGPIMMLVLPSEISLQGTSTEGHFYGTYFTGPKKFEIQVGVDSDSRTVITQAHVDEKGVVRMVEMKDK